MYNIDPMGHFFKYTVYHRYWDLSYQSEKFLWKWRILNRDPQWLDDLGHLQISIGMM